jgi:membrane-associated protein
MFENVKQLIFENEEWLKQSTYWGLFSLMFVENGFPLGFFLPGDSLLFISGFFSAIYPDFLIIEGLLLVIFFGTFLGSFFGYGLGRLLGPSLVSMNFFQTYLSKFHEKSILFYEEHGGKAFIFARFIPVFRSFVPFVSGLSHMRVKRMMLVNISGAFIWVLSLVGGGYLSGKFFPAAQSYLHLIIPVIMLLSLSPFLFKLFKYLKRLIYDSRHQ